MRKAALYLVFWLAKRFKLVKVNKHVEVWNKKFRLIQLTFSRNTFIWDHLMIFRINPSDINIMEIETRIFSEHSRHSKTVQCKGLQACFIIAPSNTHCIVLDFRWQFFACTLKYYPKFYPWIISVPSNAHCVVLDFKQQYFSKVAYVLKTYSKLK